MEADDGQERDGEREGAAGRRAGATAEAAPEVPPVDERRSLTMTGAGEAGVVPDQVAFDVSVRVERDDLTAALDAANAELARVLKALEKHGVGKGNVETTGLDIHPVYDYPEARAKAVDQATAKAEEYATATGQELGPVIRLTEVDPEQARSRVRDRLLAYNSADITRAAGEVSSLPIRTGRSELSVEVQVIWEPAE